MIVAHADIERSLMTDFVSGKLTIDNGQFGLFDSSETRVSGKREFSVEAKAVFDAGRELWKYYHSQPGINVNASLYDIREHFQGRGLQGRMNARSTDARYTDLIAGLRQKLNLLAAKIAPKVYEHGFLKK